MCIRDRLNACELPKKPMISYYEHNRRARGEAVLEKLLAGETCALVTLSLIHIFLRENRLAVDGGHAEECTQPHPENRARAAGIQCGSRACDVAGADPVSYTYLYCTGAAVCSLSAPAVSRIKQATQIAILAGLP